MHASTQLTALSRAVYRLPHTSVKRFFILLLSDQQEIQCISWMAGFCIVELVKGTV